MSRSLIFSAMQKEARQEAKKEETRRKRKERALRKKEEILPEPPAINEPVADAVSAEPQANQLPEPAAPQAETNAEEQKNHEEAKKSLQQNLVDEFHNILKVVRDTSRTNPKKLGIVILVCAAALLPHLVFAAEASSIKLDLSGYLKSFNFFTRTSGFTPEFVDNPFATSERGESVFSTLERIRLQPRIVYKIGDDQRVTVNLAYDHQLNMGSFIASDDFRIAKRQQEERQFVDLSQTLVEEDDAFYEHRLYRASILYENDQFGLEVGRQQITWGVGHFFTPTDIFNPFNPTQLELDERDGVDAVNLTTRRIHGIKAQVVYTPPGKQLHPQRIAGRFSGDIKGYEVGLLGGRVKRDHVAGFDFAGNLFGSAIRGEFLYREAQYEKDFVKFTVNADYNLPGNVHALIEYHYNGQGRRDPASYQYDRQVRGEIQQLAKNYLAILLGYDITPLLRVENRTIFNMDDVSFFVRPELQYELDTNLLLTLGAQLFFGQDGDELGDPQNLFFGEAKYSF